MPQPFYQYPQPFHLPELVSVPGGKMFTGSRARVYWLLRLTADRSCRHPVGAQTGPAGFVPRFLLVEPWSGGASGDRRARELREYGVELEIVEFDPPGGSSTTLYRIQRDGIRDGAAALPGQADSRSLNQIPVSRALLDVGSARPVVPAGPLAAVAFWALEVAGLPAGLASGRKRGIRPFGALGGRFRPLDVSPGGDSRLASPPNYVSRPAGDPVLNEGYLALLRALWMAGEFDAELASALARHGEVGFVAEVEPGCWSPIPVLVGIMDRLGARRVDAPAEAELREAS